MDYIKREITNKKSKLTVKNIKMLLPLRNRYVELKFVYKFRHKMAYKFTNN